MSVVLNLPAELERELAAEAARMGLPIAEYITRLLALNLPAHRAPRDGAELVAYWRSEGLIGTGLERAKRYHDAIHLILLQEWDPIGVAGVPEAQDEYDSYVGQIYTMLIRQEPRRKLFDYLWWVETEHMGLQGNRRHTEQVSERLMQLRQEMEGQA
jgi:hypothetical protein